MNVKIYVEGGGDSKDLRTRCRKGFRNLIMKSGFRGRMPSIHAYGGRDTTFSVFKTALENCDADTYPILLVDSEEPVNGHGIDPHSDIAWSHLESRDHWARPEGSSNDQAQLMVTSMETWIMADQDTLKTYFGSKLRINALTPVDRQLEARTRSEILQALKDATSDCGKNKGYLKGKHSFEILGDLNPEALKANLLHFNRLLETLNHHLDGTNDNETVR